MLRRLLLAALAVLIVTGVPLAAAPSARAHPMPHSVIALHVSEDHATARIELPLTDLRLAMGADPVDEAETLSDAAARQVSDYVAEHLRIATPDGSAWTTAVHAVEVTAAEQTFTGPYREVIAQAVLTPPAGASVRQFTLAYDAIVHQVVTHRILVSVENDWAGGQVEQTRDVGVIRVDTGTGEVPPLVVDLGAGSAWAGFTAMVGLGMSHILEGTDHLLFLLVLLLPAPLLGAKGRWREPAPLRHTVRRMSPSRWRSRSATR